MTIYQIDPLQDPRWDQLLQRHPRASVFHARGWLEALRETYGYTPVIFTTAAPGEALKNGIAFCRVESWVTGRRMVSLPFSDHCEPLVDGLTELSEMLGHLQLSREGTGWKYIELRPLNVHLDGVANFRAGSTYRYHKLDLAPGADRLFRNFHKDSIQRKIRRAESEKLAYEEGSSEGLLKKFYTLMLKTRRRHKLPPPPLLWFRNLMVCMGERLKIRVASKDGTPVASIVTLAYGTTLVYKYGCSDERFNNLGGSVFLLWKAIREATERGLHEFDMGRSDNNAPGLVTFKDRWGSIQSTLTYWRWPAPVSQRTNPSIKMRLVREIFTYLPDSILTAAGNVLYRHIG